MTLRRIHRLRAFAGGVLVILALLLVTVGPASQGPDPWPLRSFAALLALAGLMALPFDYTSLTHREDA